MNLYGTKGEFVYDPLSYASLLIEKNWAPNWKEHLDIFLKECEAFIEKTSDGLIHKRKVIEIGINTGFIDYRKVEDTIRKTLGAQTN